ncbi:pirin family protein [Aurantiacibacter poecillastricola]|uniref:pirin family protein n=1 Tax=Aurantiacibacter poecillastricola TaxID=3064385 RepID=UPI00273EE233|nr:pirin family protein [Aurantiacibacter sp. 219JJ12-13]MDP5261392.1 pirin family protein [Aurantiacibacter sp. 219JJ12-13]
MIEVRKFETLGKANHGWLDANFHFSFAQYFDQRRMQWGKLRVWNDDIIAPRSGFPPHGHENMEIITYVRKGAITHKDSLGNEGRTEAGDVQVMSAGTGIQHAEYNVDDEETHSFQLWIMPDRQGHAPSWGTKTFPKDARSGRFDVLASGREGDEGALTIHADARVLGATIAAGETATYDLGGRKGYLVPATGKLEIDGKVAEARDGVAIADLDTLTVKALEDSEVVLVDTA